MRERVFLKAGLQRFLLIVAVISIAAPALITGGLLIRENYQRTINKDSRLAADNYVELLRAGMTMPMWNLAPVLGKPLLDSVVLDRSVLKVVVTSKNGGVFLEFPQRPGSEGEDSLFLSRDIVFDDVRLGVLELTYSLKGAKHRAANESKLLLTIILFQLVFSVWLMSFFLKKRVIDPLTQLKNAAVGIAGGDLKTSLPELKKDEFGDLSTQLESMRGSLEQSFTTLEDRVRERTSDLENVNKELTGTLDQLQQAQGNLVQSEKLAALGALVAGVSHELNTPIGNGLTVASSLYGQTKEMNESITTGLTKTALEEYLADMTEGTHLVCGSLERASELVSSFKQVAVDRTSAQRRQFSLKGMLVETRLTMSPTFKHTPYIIDIDVPDDIILDSYPGPLGQIITNLLNNALIHAFDGRDHGRISLKAERSENGVVLYVRDDGLGIADENKSRIFDPFFTTKLGAGGNGLGMHIVHNIVTGVLGGEIQLESTVGQGTTFVLNIPLVSPDEIKTNSASIKGV